MSWLEKLGFKKNDKLNELSFQISEINTNLKKLDEQLSSLDLTASKDEIKKFVQEKISKVLIELDINNKINKKNLGFEVQKLKEQIEEISSNLNKKVDENLKKTNDKMSDIERNIREAVSRNFMVYNQHQKVFPKYKDIYKNKDVVLVATGPSLNFFDVTIKDAIYVGVNSAYNFKNINFDYLFLYDYGGDTRKFIDGFVNYRQNETKKFIGIMDDRWEQEISGIIPEKYFQYKNVEKFYKMSPRLRIRFTQDISTRPFGDAWSICFPSLQFILWTNPKRIYLVGTDVSGYGHFDGTKRWLGKNPDGAIDITRNSWKLFKNFKNTYYPDTEIISINPMGLRGWFDKDIYTQSFLKENKVENENIEILK